MESGDREKIGFALGIDSSTQSTTAVLVDLATLSVGARSQVRYRDDPRLSRFGLGGREPLLPPREEGEADQPAGLFLAALDLALSDLPREMLARVRAVAVSAQQHGQVWLGAGAAAAFAGLRLPGAGEPEAPGLADRFAEAFASGRAPIWMSSNSGAEADHLRQAAGGPEAMTALSGSDSPLRFSGAVLRHKALREPDAYADCAAVHLISSFLTGVLSGRADAPIDWGNGAGTSLMDWKRRVWSDVLVHAASEGIAGGEAGLLARLPPLSHPLGRVGTAARYFTERYGIPGDALVVAGSGDNPQTKVLASGSLLSLGTSFVLMAEGTKPHLSANAMYDGLGRPFLFGCRTNGSLAWEAVRLSHGVAADDFTLSERALAAAVPGSVLRVLQKDRESFPASPPLDLGRREDFFQDYAGAVDSALGLLWLGSRPFAEGGGPRGRLAVTGGAAASEGTLRRIAALWGLPVSRIGEAGAAAGAAAAAAVALVPEAEREAYSRKAASSVSLQGPPVEPDPKDLAAYHGRGGYLDRLRRLIDTNFTAC